MRYRVIFFIFLFFPLRASAEGTLQFSADRPVVYKKETATLSWNAFGATACNSYVDVLDVRGKWVWQFSDSWQSSSRAIKGTFEAKPADDARYYLECAIAGVKKSAFVEIQVLDREKYIKGEETPRASVVSSNSTNSQEKAKVSEAPQKTSNQKSGGEQAEKSSSGIDSSGGSANASAPASVPAPAPAASGGGPVGGSVGSAPFTSGDGDKGSTIFQGKDDIASPALRPQEQEESLTVLSQSQDSDSDLLSDEDERRMGTDPNNSDTDGDGYLEGIELQNNYNPLSSVREKMVQLKPVKKPVKKTVKNIKKKVSKKKDPKVKKSAKNVKKTAKAAAKPVKKTEQKKSKNVLNKKKKVPLKVDKKAKKE